MKKLNLRYWSLISWGLTLFQCADVHSQNDAMMQAFYWNVPVDEVAKNGTWWTNLESKTIELKNAGITGLWVPAPSKGNWGDHRHGLRHLRSL